jgi:hypothetical protein
MGENFKPQSLSRRGFIGLPGPLSQGGHADPFSVARVRPRTSKGITDLLLLNLVRLYIPPVPLRRFSFYAGSESTAPAAASATRQRRALGLSVRAQTLVIPVVRLFNRLELRSLPELT